MASPEWPQERTAELCRLWDLGQSASAIGIRLGVPRNAVIGKVHRLRKAGHPFKREKMTAVQAGHSRGGRPRLSREQRIEDQSLLQRVRMAAKAEQTAASPRHEPAVIDASFAKPWTERRFGECAYPIGGEGADTVSCCAPTKGKSYCRAHHQLMFKRPLKVGDQYVKATARLAA